MGTTTPNYLLPRPVGADDANVPLWLTQLTDRLEALLNGGGAEAGLGMWSVGDFKLSSRNASHGRWLICDGRALTQAQIETELGIPSGSASIIINLWGTGATSWYDTADNTPAGQVRLPDARGRAISCIGAGGGLTARTKAEQYGAETVTLTGAQSGVPAHSHAAGSLADEAHTHAFLVNSAPGQHAQARGAAAGPYFVSVEDHIHVVGGNTGPASDTNGGTANNPAAGAAQSHPNIGPSYGLGNLFVRV